MRGTIALPLLTGLLLVIGLAKPGDMAEREIEEDGAYEWAGPLIGELFKKGYNRNQIKNIITHLYAESDGRADAVQGDWKPGFKGDPGGYDVGRGLVQLTGKANYVEMERLTGIPLTKDPKLAAKPENSAIIAATYFKRRQETHGKKHNLDYETFESVHRALAPKDSNPDNRLKIMEKKGLRMATEKDVFYHAPPYDPNAFILNPDGTLTSKQEPKIR